MNPITFIDFVINFLNKKKDFVFLYKRDLERTEEVSECIGS